MTDQTLLEHKARQRAEADAFLADPAVHTPRYLPVLIVAPTATRVRIAQPGEVFYDAAGFVSVQCVTNAAKVGDHVSLYMGGRYGCTRAHVEAAWAEGAGVVPNWERNADQALKGYTDGRVSVDSAMVTAAQWGLDPSQVPVAYSGVDFGPTTAQYSALDDWHRGVQDRSDEHGAYPPIAYGHTGYLGHLSQQPWWRGGTWVWGGSGTLAQMSVKQHITPTTNRDISRIGCTVDENIVHLPIPIWSADHFDPVEVDVTPDEMRVMWEKEFFPQIHAEILSQVTRSDGGGGPGTGEYSAWVETYLERFLPKIRQQIHEVVLSQVTRSDGERGPGTGEYAGWAEIYAQRALVSTGGGDGPTLDQFVEAAAAAFKAVMRDAWAAVR